MARFREYINSWVPPEDGNADLNTIFADLTSAYDEDFSIAAAAVDERDKALAEKDAAIASLKSQNYDLLMAAPADDAGPSGEPSKDDDRDDEITPDDLFEN